MYYGSGFPTAAINRREIAAREGGLSDSARVLDLAERDEDAGESDLAEGAAAGMAARAQSDDLLGGLAGDGPLKELLHALAGLGGQRRVIERADPRRWLLGR
jgi:hypothetical protein